MPVPIGPALPCYDQEDEIMRYSHLMLILFKLWRSVQDLVLQGSEGSWKDAYHIMLPTLPDHIKLIIANLDVMNQCRNSRNDHMRRGVFRQQKRPVGLRGSTLIDNNLSFSHHSEDMHTEETTEEELHEYLASMNAAKLIRKSHSTAKASNCVNIAQNYSLYRFKSDDMLSTDLNNVIDVQNTPETERDMESSWRAEYECRRAEWKHRQISYKVSDTAATLAAMPVIAEGPAIMDCDSLPDVPLLLSQSLNAIISDAIFDPAVRPVNVSAHATKWTLNTEQRRAFSIVAEHSMTDKPEPLHMFLGGFGGTGKSRVIHALTSFFEERGQSRRLRLTSYTGIAAWNIAGSTLHAALSLDLCRSKKLGSRNLTNLKAMWEGVDYLLIDEVSMVGCKLMASISEALAEAKGQETAFGGMNVILAGDFAQLPPVSETHLYAWINTGARYCSSDVGQRVVMGKLLWLSFKIVVILHEVMRQRGSENAAFVDLPARLREGRCTEQDYNLLQSRLVENNHDSL